MPISRSELLKELLPGLNELFGIEYDKYEKHRYDRNRQAHGLDKVNERQFTTSYKTPPEGYTQRSSV